MKVPVQRPNEFRPDDEMRGAKMRPSQKFRDEHERIFGKKKPTPGYTIIRIVKGKRVEVRNCETKSRREVGLAPLPVNHI